jgi:hypothetical protein
VAVDRSWPRLRVVPIAPLIAEAISRLHAGESLGSLFQGTSTPSAPIPHANAMCQERTRSFPIPTTREVR